MEKKSEFKNFDDAYEGFGISPESILENYSELIRLMNNDTRIPGIFIKVSNADVIDRKRQLEEWGEIIGTHEIDVEKILNKCLKHYDNIVGISTDILDYWIIEEIECGI